MTELWRHFLRWAVTIRDLNPAGHYGAIITQPFALALLAGLILPGGWALALVALVARLMVAGAMRHSAGRPCAPLWLVPLGDIFGFCVFCVSLFARKIDWRGAGLTIAAKGRIADRSATPDQRDQ